MSRYNIKTTMIIIIWLLRNFKKQKKHPMPINLLWGYSQSVVKINNYFSYFYQFSQTHWKTTPSKYLQKSFSNVCNAVSKLLLDLWLPRLLQWAVSFIYMPSPVHRLWKIMVTCQNICCFLFLDHFLIFVFSDLKTILPT